MPRDWESIEHGLINQRFESQIPGFISFRGFDRIMSFISIL